MEISKNQQWKMWKTENGSDMSFKDWIHKTTDDDVQKTVSFIGADGSDSTGTVDPNKNYQPTLKGNTILGVNKWLVYTILSLAVVGVGIAIVRNAQKK